MIFFVLIYLFALGVIFFIIYKLKNKSAALPKLVLTKYGLVFNTFLRHKIFVGSAKLMVLDKVAYLKQNNKMIILKNISKAELKKGYLYFTGLGRVSIVLNCKSFYRQFNVNINSANFSLESLKNNALNELVNNLFNINACKLVKRYLHAFNILNIKIDEGKLIIKQNKYFLPFHLTYKVKNTLKTVKINQKVEL